MSLEDIQLDIVVNLQGLPQISSLTRALQGVTQAANQVRKNAESSVNFRLRDIKSWDDLTDALSRVERKYDAIFRAGVHMTQMGHALLDVSQRLVRTGVELVESYADYDFMLRRGAVALNTNVVWQGRLDAAIKTTAKSLGLFSPVEVAEAYYIWGAASGVVVDSQEKLALVTAVVEDVMIATAMAGGTLETNLKGVWGVLSQFNLSADKASYVTQVLALMTERTAADFGDLINALTYIGPLAASLGITFEDVTSTLGLLADAGQRGSRAGRGLAMVIEGLSAPSGPAKKALDGLIQSTHGMNAEFAQVMFPGGQFVGMRKFVIEMAMAVNDLTDAERGRLYATAFTNNATRALIPVIEDQIRLNRENAAAGREFTSVLDAQKYSLEGTAEFFANMQTQALTSIRAITGQLKNTFFPILQRLALTVFEMAKPFLKMVENWAIAFDRFIEANPELVETAVRLAAIVAVVTAAGGVFFTLAGAILYVIGNIGNFVQGIGKVMGPFAILAVAIGGLVVAIIKNVRGIRDAVIKFVISFENLVHKIVGDGSILTDAWGGLWSTLRDIGEDMVGLLATVLSTLSDWMDKLAQNDDFVNFMRDVISFLVPFRSALTGLALASGGLWAAGKALGFFTAALKILTGYTMVKGVVISIAAALVHLARSFVAVRAALAAGGIVTALSTLATALGGGAIVSAIGTFVGLLRVAASAIWSVTVALLANPIVWLIAAIAAAVAFLYLAWENNWFGFRDIVSNVLAWLSGAVETVVGFIQGVISFFANLPQNLQNLWNSIVTGVTQAVTAIAEWLGSLPGRIAEWIAGILESIVQFGADLIANVAEFLSYVANNWTYWLGYVIGYVLGWIANFLIETAKFLADLVARFVEWLGKLPGVFADFLSQVWTNVTTWAADMVAKAIQFGTDFVTNIANWISQLPGRIAAFLSDVWNNVVTWFLTTIPQVATKAALFVQSVVTAVASLPGKVLQLFNDVKDDVLTFLRQLPGNLWTALTSVGRKIIEGIWAGITGAWTWFTNQLSNFFDGLIDGAKDALQIQSPSKVFAEIGSQIVAGMASGINGSEAATTALANYRDTLVGIANGTSLAFAGVAADLPASSLISVQSEGRSVLRVELDVTSSDGSVDDLTLSQLKSALTSSELVTAIERMAEGS